MIKIAVVGDIGSGKSYIANLFGYPVFNADLEVAKIYKINKSCFKRLKKDLPKYIGDKYSDVFQHPNEDRWAVPCTNDGALAVTNSGVELTEDWFPPDPAE